MQIEKNIIPQNISSFLQDTTIYVRVIEGGGTGNEAAAYRLVKYLDTLNIDITIKVSTITTSSNSISDSENIEFERNETSTAKLLKLGLNENLLIKTSEDLNLNKDFMVIVPADGNPENGIALGKFILSFKRNESEGNFLGELILNPFGWHENKRSIKLLCSNESTYLNLPKLADYPNTRVLNEENLEEHHLIKLVNTLDEQGIETLFTYGLHALFNTDEGCTIKDDAENDTARFWSARALALLCKGVMNSENKKHTVILAMHPANGGSKKYFGLTNENVIEYCRNACEPKFETGKNHYHLIPSDCYNLEELCCKIIESTEKQVILILKMPEDHISPEVFRMCMQQATLPALVEGANTLGQLYAMGKPFFTLGYCESQIIDIDEEKKRNKYWKEVLEKQKFKGFKEDNLEENNSNLLKCLKEIKDTFFFYRNGKMSPFAATELSNENYKNYKKEFLRFSEVITDFLNNQNEMKNYLEELQRIKNEFGKELQNQVVLGLLAFLIKHQEFLQN